MSIIKTILPALLGNLLSAAQEAKGSILLPGAVADTVHTMGEFAKNTCAALDEKHDEIEALRAEVAELKAAQEASTAAEASFLEKLAELEARIPKA